MPRSGAFVLRLALAFVVVLASPLLGMRPAAAWPCAYSLLRVEKLEGNVYGLIVAAQGAQPSSGPLKLDAFTHSSRYSVASDVMLEVPNAVNDKPDDNRLTKAFRSKPLYFTLPGNEPLDAIAVDQNSPDPTRVCDLAPYIMPAALPHGDVVRSDTEYRKLASEITAARSPSASGMTVGPAADLTPPVCALPYADAKVTKPVTPAVPQFAMLAGQQGMVQTLVSLDATGAVRSAVLYRSSGSPLLDASGVRAASVSRYSPEIFRCEPVGSSYIFRAEFESNS